MMLNTINCGGLPPQIAAQAEQLVAAVAVALSPTALAEERNLAYSLCEKFKEESPMCAIVGFHLAQVPDPTTRHFGLQLIEHCIKFRWKDLHTQEKISIKENVWKLVEASYSSGEASFIKDGLARLVVEMVKREWPQQWPTFLPELMQLTRSGNAFQIELVLLVLLRLTEDVVVFQSVDATRRRDLYQSITANMETIFDFLAQLLEQQVRVAANSRLAKCVLQVFQALVDFVAINHIMANDGQLLVRLCFLLSNTELRLSAADCLLAVVGRKGPTKERAPLLILLSADAISSMLQAAQLASSCNSEQSYAFLKRLSEVLAGLGAQLCALYGREETVSRPEALPTYLQALLALSQHPSLSINQAAATLWIGLFRHDQLSTDPDVLCCIGPWLEIARQKLILPSAEDQEKDPFAQIDFDSDEEIVSFRQRFRSEMLEASRLATVLAPQLAFDCASRWLINILDASQTSAAPVAEWEALPHFLDSVTGRVQTHDIELGPVLLERCLIIVQQQRDPVIISELLSCISALFVYVQKSPERLLRPVLDAILSSVLFGSENNESGKRSKEVQTVRRHACSLLVKISLTHPSLLVTAFDYLKGKVWHLALEGHLLPASIRPSRMEVVTLQEALLVVSNQLSHFQQQVDFVGQLLTGPVQQWATIVPSFNSAQEFITFAGLDRPPTADADSFEDEIGQRRSQLSACTSVFLAVIKRCRSWSSLQDEDGNGLHEPQQQAQHPGGRHLEPLLLSLFQLARVLQQLFNPEARKLLSPAFGRAHDLLDSDITTILNQGGVSQVIGQQQRSSTASSSTSADQGQLERVQTFLTQLHANVFIILGALGETISHESFYGQPGLSLAVAGIVCSELDHCPDQKLRVILRSFCRPFVLSCPAPLHNQVVLPFLTHFLPAMFQILSARWQSIISAAQQQQATANGENKKNGVGDKEPDLCVLEVCEDILARLLTKDYIDLIKVLIFTAPQHVLQQQMASGEEEMMDDETGAPGQQHSSSVQVSQLGRAVLQDSQLAGPLLLFVFSTLWWPDSGNSIKAAIILETVVKFWASNAPVSLPNCQTATLCLQHVLQGIQQLGQHEANLAQLTHLGVVIYDTFAPVFPDAFADVMMRCANCTREDTNAFMSKCVQQQHPGAAANNKQNQKVDRAKRELFRKMTSQIVGQHLADLFRKPVEMVALPKMGSLKPRAQRPVDIIGDSAESAGLDYLFYQE